MKDPFATLGLPRRFALDRAELDARYRELQRALHPDRHVDEPPAQRRLALQKAVEVNEAYRLLKDDVRRAEALLGDGGAPVARDKTVEPEFLMEIMELREALSEAKQRRDLDATRALAAKVNADAERVLSLLSTGLDALSAAPSESVRQELSALLGRFKYYRRFLDEVAVIEEEAEEARV